MEAFATTLTLGWDADAERVLVEARADPVEVEVEIESEDDDEAMWRTSTRPRSRPGPEQPFQPDARIAASLRAVFERTDEDEVDDLEVPGRSSVRALRLPGSIIRRAARVVASGRPPCSMCGQPLDPQGHICPRRNGTSSGARRWDPIVLDAATALEVLRDGEIQLVASCTGRPTTRCSRWSPRLPAAGPASDDRGGLQADRRGSPLNDFPTGR